jgi:TatD DNase family protein
MKDIFQRSKEAGLRSFVITGGSLSESRHALALARQCGVFCTTGCHPTRSGEFDKHPGGAGDYLRELDELIGNNVYSKVSKISDDGLKGRGVIVAVGECGLGQYCSISLKRR